MENKLADTVSKRPLALTIGAAAVTLLVILGVLTGPSFVSCFNSADGMGQCLRDKMVDAGLVPAPPPTAVADAVVEPETQVNLAVPIDAPPQEPELAVSSAPALDVTPPAEPNTPAEPNPPAEPSGDDLVAATFGLLRAEPDGSVVIAGSGTPGTEVQIYADGEQLGSVTVEQSGDWAFVPDAPLAPGGLEITLGEAGKPGTAAESFIVVIDDDKTTQPLVIASTPGQASEVLQGLTAREETVVAAADTPEAAPAIASAEPDAGVEAPARPETIEQPETVKVPVAPTSDTPAAKPGVAAAPEQQQSEPPSVTTPETDTTEPAEDTLSAAVEPPATAAADPGEPALDTEAPVVDVAEAPVSTADEAVVADIMDSLPPTIDAIEKEGDRTFFAGAGPEGGTVRLYVDDQFVADAEVSDGRWLVEAGSVLDKPNQRVRADLLREGSADVASRAEVDFVINLPETEETVQVAQATPGAVEEVEQQEIAVAPEPTAEPASAATVAEETANFQPAPPAPPAIADSSEASAPASVAPADVAPASVEEVTREQTPPVVAATEAAQEPASANTVETAPVDTEVASQPAPTIAPEAAPAESQLPTDTVPDVEPTSTEPAQALTSPLSSPAAKPEPEVPTVVAVSLGDPESQRFASGKAIIRRGDNLWTIARRVYGEGIKYTTIYDANTGQIRDPDRIYPGQVFDLPEGL